MLISRNWLQSYFDKELPSAQEIADTLLVHSFEIEGIQELPNGDSVIDIDVLPNRAHDCLSHYGIAKEYDGLTSYTYNLAFHEAQKSTSENLTKVSLSEVPNINVTSDSCHRYFAFMVDEIEVTESPLWLQERLQSIGARVINNIVDITNYLMFDMGQPMHAFDADKIVGSIEVRNARTGETFVSLSGEEVNLTEQDLVIADQEGVLALAGIKGGTKAEVTSTTKRILVEMGNFQYDTTRLTSRRVKIQTDSSKRFENQLHPGLIDEVIAPAKQLFATIGKGAIGQEFDYYPTQADSRSIKIELSKINKVLGTSLDLATVTSLLDQFSFVYTTNDEILDIKIPYLRLDLNLPEDIIEEIGRWYGYQHIPSTPVVEIKSDPAINTIIKLSHQIRNYLVDQSYREVSTYSFVPEGEVSVANPIASDKPALRTNLLNPGITKAREQNLKNAGFLGLDRIQIFEIGRIYRDGEEKLSLVVSCENVHKKAKKEFGDEASQLEQLAMRIDEMFGSVAYTKNIHEKALEYIFDYQLAMSTDSQETYGEVFASESFPGDSVYHEISVYPYSIRDVSLWVNEGVAADEVAAHIKDVSGSLLQRYYLFDEFTKDGRTSYAFSLVLQAFDRTLSDVDIDSLMTNLTKSLEDQGWEVR